jgi:hypothetical protein
MEATRFFAAALGEQYIHWNILVQLFDALLLRDQGQIEKTMGPITVAPNGKLKYYDYAYKAAVEQVLKQGAIKKSHWEWTGYDAANRMKKQETRERLIANVVDQLYTAK